MNYHPQVQEFLDNLRANKSKYTNSQKVAAYAAFGQLCEKYLLSIATEN